MTFQGQPHASCNVLFGHNSQSFTFLTLRVTVNFLWYIPTVDTPFAILLSTGNRSATAVTLSRTQRPSIPVNCRPAPVQTVPALSRHCQPQVAHSAYVENSLRLEDDTLVLRMGPPCNIGLRTWPNLAFIAAL